MGVGFFVVEVSAEDLDSSDRQPTKNEVGEKSRTPREGRGMSSTLQGLKGQLKFSGKWEWAGQPHLH